MGKEKAPGEQGPGLRSSEGGQPTDAHSTEPKSGKQDEPRTLLIGSAASVQKWIDGCPYATTITGYSMSLESWVMIAIRCKRWGCRHCGERKIIHFGHRVTGAEPNRLITLTVDTKLYEKPREAYDKTRRALTQLATRLRRKHGEFEYFRVLETTKKGWPHYHLVVRSDYIPQKTISTLWAELTGATIVDVRTIKKPSHVYKYIIKYLGKQTHVPWTNRRLSWSRNFFKDDGFQKGPSLDMAMQEWKDSTPEEFLFDEFQGVTLTEFSRDCWIIDGSKCQQTIRPGEPWKFPGGEGSVRRS